MYTILRQLEGSYTSQVFLVDVAGTQAVLKRANREEIANERRFQILVGNHLHRGLLYTKQNGSDTELLLHYIDGSPTLSKCYDEHHLFLLGKTMRALHDITFPYSFAVDGNNEEIRRSWMKYLERCEQYVHERSKVKNTTLPERVFHLLHDKIAKIEDVTTYSLLHLDLHSNNVLIEQEQVYLFDKGSDHFAGDPLYDLATLGIEFCDVLYGIGDEVVKTRHGLWNAFIQGYGENHILSYGEKFDTYVFLRALERYPNSFEPRLEALIHFFIN